MSSAWFTLPAAALTVVLRLLLIFLAALLLNRALRALASRIVQPAASSARSAQAREQQTRSLADLLYGTASKVVWLVALLTALALIGINPIPALLALLVLLLVAGLACAPLLRDVIGGAQVILEDQYAPGDTIRIACGAVSGDAVEGRVEQFSLRRTLLRDAAGAVITVPNGGHGVVANLSRDWSQAFVDVPVAQDVPLEAALQALEAAAAGLRQDAAWSQALLDGPRVLGVQRFERDGAFVRATVRTAPTRQEEVARELRRRIQLELERRGYSAQAAQAARPAPAG
jgi:small conductance mechanosensitive channel